MTAGQPDVAVVNAGRAAAENANILVGQNRSWRHTIALGFGAVTFAILDLAEAIREQRATR